MCPAGIPLLPFLSRLARALLQLPPMSEKVAGARLRTAALGLFLTCVLFPAAAHPEPRATAQAVAPTIDLPTDDGRIKPADLAGKVVYVDFFASWCGPCKVSFPWLKAMHEQYAAQGLVIVAINVDKDRADARRFIAHFSPSFLIGYDRAGKTAEAFHVEGMPSSFLISPTGTILYSHVGFDSKDAATIEAQIKKALIQ